MKTGSRVVSWSMMAASMLAFAANARADQVVQVPLDALLNGRAVSTLTNGVVVPWTDGLDQTDGLMTTAAEMFLHQSGVALPDDGRFPANDRHPEVVLHFSNAAPATSKQVFYLRGAGNAAIDIPAGHYTKLFLILLSSYGASPLMVTLTYQGGATTMQDFTLPDWGTGQALPTTPPIFFNLIAGMHKWNQQDQSIDTPTHAITGVALDADGTKVLTRLTITKTSAAQYLTLWGVTGVATSLTGGASDGGADDGSADVPPADADADAGAPAPDAPVEATPPAPVGDDAASPAAPESAVDRGGSAGSGGGTTSVSNGCVFSGGTPAGAGGLLLLLLAMLGRRRASPRRPIRP